MWLGFILYTALLLFVLAWIFKVEKGISPSNIFLLIWSVLSLAGMLVYSNKYDFGAWGSIYILLTGLCFSWGAFQQNAANTNRPLTTEKDNIRCRLNINIKIANLFMIVVCCTLIVALLEDIMRYGYNFSSVSAFLQTARVVRRGVYEARSSFSKFAMPIGFSSFILDGYLFALAKLNKIKYKTHFFYVYILICFIGILETAKSMLFWGLILWLSGFLTGHIQADEKKINISAFIRKYFFKVFWISCVFVVAMFGMIYLRNGSSFDKTIEWGIEYALGVIPVFSVWLEESRIGNLQFSLGKQTFYGVFSVINRTEGISANWPGPYSLWLKGCTSNIHGAFRGCIEDFGYYFSFLFWILLGLIYKVSMRNLKKSKFICVSATVLASIYLFVFMSSGISAWHYPSLILAYVFFFFELEAVYRINLKWRYKFVIRERR